MKGFQVGGATREDVPLILAFIRELAEYEKLSHEVVANEEGLRESLFGERPVDEAYYFGYCGLPAPVATSRIVLPARTSKASHRIADDDEPVADPYEVT